MQLRLRKKQSNLAALGLGVIAFGVWSIIKPLLYLALDSESYLGSFKGDKYLLLTFWILLAGTLAIDLALRLHIGRSAIAEGKGADRKPGYIVLSFIIAVISFALLTIGLLVQSPEGTTGNTVVAMLVELTSDVLLMDVGITAIRVKCMKKRITGAET